MDVIIILIIGLVFCMKSAKKEDTLEMIVEEQMSSTLETKLNPDFFEDEHAFEVIANGLNFY